MHFHIPRCFCVCPFVSEINEMFRSYTADPILVIVDVNPKGELEIPTQAYVSIESKPEESSVSRRSFRHVLSEVGAYEAEEVGVEHLLRNVGDTSESSLTDQVRAKVSSLKALRNRLQDIALYVDRVLSGKLPVNHAILYNLQDMFNLMPDLQLTELSAAFTANTNDNFMAIYIASLIRSICALHDLIKSVRGRGTNRRMGEWIMAKAAAIACVAAPPPDCVLTPFASLSFLRSFSSLCVPCSNKIVNKAVEIEEGKTEAEKRAERQKKIAEEEEKKRQAKLEEERKKKEKEESNKGKKKKDDF